MATPEHPADRTRPYAVVTASGILLLVAEDQAFAIGRLDEHARDVRAAYRDVVSLTVRATRDGPRCAGPRCAGLTTLLGPDSPQLVAPDGRPVFLQGFMLVPSAAIQADPAARAAHWAKISAWVKENAFTEELHHDQTATRHEQGVPPYHWHTDPDNSAAAHSRGLGTVLGLGRAHKPLSVRANHEARPSDIRVSIPLLCGAFTQFIGDAAAKARPPGSPRHGLLHRGPWESDCQKIGAQTQHQPWEKLWEFLADALTQKERAQIAPLLADMQGAATRAVIPPKDKRYPRLTHLAH